MEYFLFEGYSEMKIRKTKFAKGLGVQRIFDLIVVFCALLLTLPLMLIIAILIKIESSGPVFYKQRRIGWHGKIISIHRFRTMYVDSGDMVIRQRQSANTDPRVTRIGRILRGHSLDELPQLLDGLSGKLALVGPRPMLPYETDQLKAFHPD